MIIAIAVNENHVKALVDPHFGRCNWFCLYDTETMKWTFVENPVRNHQKQVGSEAALFLVGKNTEMAIAGRFGSKVIEVFRENNIQMVIPELQPSLKEIFNLIK